MNIYESTITELRKLLESLVWEVNQFIDSLNKRQTKEKTTLSAYELRLGSADLPADLSHNKKYMEGYGK